MSRMFDGSTNSKLIKSSPNSQLLLNNSSPLSAVAWIFPMAAASLGSRNIIARASTIGTGIYFRLDNGRTLTLASDYATDLSATSDNSANNLMPIGSWQPAGFTWDGSTDGRIVRFYNHRGDVTGNSNGAVGIRADNGANNFTIGGHDAGNATCFIGLIAHVQVFNVQLSAIEIQQAFYFPGSVTRGLVGYWPLFGYANPEPDMSGNKNDLTISGNVTMDERQPPIGGMFNPRVYRFPFAVSNAIAFDAASNSGYQAAASTYSWNHTCTGSNRYLTVGISMLSLAQTVSGITYNGTPLTFLGAQSSVSGAARVELWGLVNPSSGTNSIAVTLTGAIASAGNASSYTGVHQDSPTEAFNSAQATNVGAADATVNVTSVADKDWAVDIIATDDTAITAGAGQTATGNVSGAGGSGAMSYEGPKTPPGAITMSWTDIAALATWAVGSIALRPVAAASLVTASSSIIIPKRHLRTLIGVGL